MLAFYSPSYRDVIGEPGMDQQTYLGWHFQNYTLLSVDTLTNQYQVSPAGDMVTQSLRLRIIDQDDQSGEVVVHDISSVAKEVMSRSV